MIHLVCVTLPSQRGGSVSPWRSPVLVIGCEWRESGLTRRDIEGGELSHDSKSPGHLVCRFPQVTLKDSGSASHVYRRQDPIPSTETRVFRWYQFWCEIVQKSLNKGRTMPINSEVHVKSLSLSLTAQTYTNPSSLLSHASQFMLSPVLV